MAKLLLTEFIGTFFLVLTIGLTVVAQSPFAPLAIGSGLMMMVYMGGHVSGAHYNPAVSLAIFLRGKLDAKLLLPYWGAQLAGAIVAAHGTMLIMGSPLVVAPSSSIPPIYPLVLEFLFTFALALVVLNTATATATQGNSYYGLAIGFTVMVGAFAAGPISGGAFNPAVGLGPALVDMLFAGGSFGQAWIYLVGPLLGAWAAAAVFKLQNPVG
ncbi:MAG TPA: aquaporin [Gemmatimonadales bacterium]|nr:aquaporin [Gemmatimonadales bacterium]